MKKLIVSSALTALMCGCVSVNKNDGGNSAIAPTLIKDTVHEKYEVGQTTVSGSDKIKCLFGFISWGSTATHVADLSDSGIGGVGRVKNGAYANACDAAQCDSLVGTKYKVTAKLYTWLFHIYDEYQAELTGYPVKLVGAEVIPAINSQGFSQGAVKDGACKGSPLGL